MELFKYYASVSAFFILLVLETLFPLFVGRKKRFRHISRNLSLIIINNLFVFALLSFATNLVFQTIEQNQLGIINRFVQSPLWRVIFLIIIFDFWMYIWHLMVHHFSFFWRFHRMHHTDTDMDASTALRFHPGEIIASSILRWGVFLVIGMTAKDLLLYEALMLPVIFFHHSNFFLPEKADRIFRGIIITPWIHWVHHSNIVSETNSNYGTILSWWDRLFGTFRLRQDPRMIKYGLDEMQNPYWQTILGMLKTPFLNKFDK